MNQDKSESALQKRLFSSHYTVQSQAFRALLAQVEQQQPAAIEQFRQLLVNSTTPDLLRTAAFHVLPRLVRRNIIPWKDAQEDLIQTMILVGKSSPSTPAVNTKEELRSFDMASIINTQLQLVRLVALQPGSSFPSYTTRNHPLIIMMERSSATSVVHQMLFVIEDTIVSLIQPALNNSSSEHAKQSMEAANQFIQYSRFPLIYAMSMADTTMDAEGVARLQTCSMLTRIIRVVHSLHQQPFYTALFSILIEGWRLAWSSSPSHPTIASMAEMIVDVDWPRTAATSSYCQPYLIINGQLWSILMDGAMAQQPISLWIHLLQRSYGHCKANELNIHYQILAAVGITFLLSTSISPLDQTDLLGLWEDVSAGITRSKVALLAASPLLQLSIDATTTEVRVKASNLFNKLVLTSFEALPSVDWQSFIGSMEWTGTWATLVHYTHIWWQDISNTGVFDTTTLMGHFFIISRVFDRSIPFSLNHFILSKPELVHLPVLFYILRTGNDKACINVLLKALPSLAQDAYGTAAVIKVATGLLSYRKDGQLAATGLRMLLAIWRVNPRAWRILRSACMEWIQRRQSTTSLTSSSSSLIMDLAVISCLKEAVLLRGKEYAEDVLSLAALLLRCRLAPLSIAMIVDTITICVQADVVDARTVWTVLVEPVGIIAKRQNNTRLLCALCRFFSLVGNIKEDTEGHVQFKQAILEEYLHPLAFPQTCTNPLEVDGKVRDAALQALSHFSNDDIESITQYTPRDLLANMLAHPRLSSADFLSSFIQRELMRMRRGLMKGGRFAGGSSTGEPRWLNTLKNSLSSWQAQWHSGEMSTALIGIGAAAVLHQVKVTFDTTSMAQLISDLARDASFSDNFIWRSIAVSSWTNLFRQLLVQHSDTDTLMHTCYTAIVDQLAVCRVPKDIGNLIFALGGFCCALYECALNTATSALILRSVRLLMSEERRPQIVSGDYANFATTMVIGKLTSLLAPDEPLIEQVATQLKQGLSASSARNGNGHEGWQYGCLNGLAQLVKCLYEAVTLSDKGWSLREELMDLLINSLHPTSQTTVLGGLGAGLGLAELCQWNESIHSIVYSAAVELINDHISNEQNPGKLAGAAWIVAMSAPKSDRAIQLQLLQQLQSITGCNQDHWTEGWSAVQSAYAYLLHHHLQATGQQSSILSTYYTYINEQLNTIESSATPSAYRQMAVMNLGVALGFTWSSSIKEGVVPFYQTDASSEPILRLWRACSSETSTSTRDIKSSRMVGLMAIRWTNELQMDRDHELIHANSNRIDGNSSHEPHDLTRLPSTSYLRAVFDVLTEMVQGGIENETKVLLLLQALSHVSWQYPIVNWWPVLSRLLEWPSSSIRSCLLHIATRHASYSSSLLKVLQLMLLRFQTEQSTELRCHLVGELGVGRLLALIGLGPIQALTSREVDCLQLNKQRGTSDEDAGQTSTISAAQVQSVLQSIEETLFGLESNQLTEERLIYLSTLANHLDRPSLTQYIIDTDRKKEKPQEETEAAEETLYQTRLNLRHRLHKGMSNREIYLTVKASLSLPDEMPTTIRSTREDAFDHMCYAKVICALVKLGRLPSTRYLVKVIQKTLDRRTTQEQFIDFVHYWILPALYQQGRQAKLLPVLGAEWLIRWLDVLILQADKPNWPEMIEWFIRYLLPGTIQVMQDDLSSNDNNTNYEAIGLPKEIDARMTSLYRNHCNAIDLVDYAEAFYATAVIGDFVVELPISHYELQRQVR
ncbi:hypothetical protein BDF22DRAFT_691432 [Syncephalis plumigaleata]|nr:hypothetical protein BDF22DRAFT_691432 [Syncephalis plumigaleata]